MTKIELTPRKQAVLKAIVKAYIETGEPIGSKFLTGLIYDKFGIRVTTTFCTIIAIMSRYDSVNTLI